MVSWEPKMLLQVHSLATNVTRALFVDAIFLPHSNYNDVELVDLNECVWKGLGFSKTFKFLASHAKYSKNYKIKHLFCKVLKLPNASIANYLNKLEYLQEDNVSFSNLCSTYQEISKLASSDNALDYTQ